MKGYLFPGMPDRTLSRIEVLCVGGPRNGEVITILDTVIAIELESEVPPVPWELPPLGEPRSFVRYVITKDVTADGFRIAAYDKRPTR